MEDIKLAKRLLKEDDNTLVVVKSNKVIFQSNDRGIKPMFTLTKEMKDESKDCSIADKVIGRGAALLSSYLNVKEVYGQLISKGAIDILQENNIRYSFETSCDFIKNRDKTGLCPIENLSLNISDSNEFISKVEEFLKSK